MTTCLLPKIICFMNNYQATLFNVGKTNRNGLKVMGIDSYAIQDFLDFGFIDYNHDFVPVGTPLNLTYNADKLSYILDFQLFDSSLTFSSVSWTGFANNMLDGEPITDDTLLQASFNNPVPIWITKLECVSVLSSSLLPVHYEGKVLTKNSKLVNSFTIIMTDELDNKTEVSHTSSDDTTNNKTTLQIDSSTSESSKFDISDTSEVSSTNSENQVRQNEEDNSFHKDLKKLVNSLGKNLPTKSDFQQLKEGLENSANRAYFRNKEIAKFDKKLGILLKNALLTSTAGAIEDMQKAMMDNFSSSNNFLSAFCNFRASGEPRNVQSFSNLNFPTIPLIAENASQAVQDFATLQGCLLVPSGAVPFSMEVSGMQLESGLLDEVELGRTMRQGVERALVRHALFGKASSPLMEGIVNNTNITPVVASATFTLSDFGKLTKSLPFAYKPKFVIGRRTHEAILDILEDEFGGNRNGNDFTQLREFVQEQDWVEIDSLRGRPAIVLNDDIIPVASNLQTAFYGNFKALCVNASAPRFDKVPKAGSPNTYLLYMTSHAVDAKVSDISQLLYMTGVPVAI